MDAVTASWTIEAEKAEFGRTWARAPRFFRLLECSHQVLLAPPDEVEVDPLASSRPWNSGAETCSQNQTLRVVLKNRGALVPEMGYLISFAVRVGRRARAGRAFQG